ncbi:hypothetical protein QMO56_08095 [Roseomonas sp. E05]|uniref:hypothetical protein n=1 Tax=Roseomonas sp. E05 TaxID=3046310 RepID=UPI0024BAFD5A|nr:hypothetical protein [Roseomonas sp. E05]MDJ0388073.1 hypothetical protein [Roseomonas sp. E05]
MRLAARIFVFLTLLAPPALAQTWPNETGPGGDLFRNSSRQFERLWQAAPQSGGLPEARPGLPRPVAQPVVPMLDWTPPPPAAPKRPPRRRPATAPAARAASQPAPSRQDWERTLAERERELESLRRRLDEDRRRFEAQGKTP